MSTNTPERSWQDEAPVTAPPFDPGDLFERPDGDHLRYYRVVTVSEDRSVILFATFVGKLIDANTPKIRKALARKPSP